VLLEPEGGGPGGLEAPEAHADLAGVRRRVHTPDVPLQPIPQTSPAPGLTSLQRGYADRMGVTHSDTRTTVDRRTRRWLG
jgi:hypothetical protein